MRCPEWHSFCSFEGNRDYSPYLSLLPTIKFWKAFGLDKAWSYIDKTLATGVEVLVKEWGTNSLLPNSLKCRCMALVRLPNELLEASLDVSPANVVQVIHGWGFISWKVYLACQFIGSDYCLYLTQWVLLFRIIHKITGASFVQSTLHHVHRIEAPVKTIDGYLYIRVSVHIYTTEEDFKKLATAISGMASNCIKKKWNLQLSAKMCLFSKNFSSA